jgi:aspartate-semialdehyde dehydrogenase
MKQYNVAVAGATGAVGNEMVKVLEERNFPVKNLTLLASSRSVGKTMSFHGQDVDVQELKEDSFKDIDIGLFSPGGAISTKFAPIAAASGCVVIDNTSAFRMDPDIPLVVVRNKNCKPLHGAQLHDSNNHKPCQYNLDE